VRPDLGGTGGSTSEFLVRMENLLPASFPADERARLFPYLDIEVIPLSRHPNDPQH